jgi:hypothetical protein
LQAAHKKQGQVGSALPEILMAGRPTSVELQAMTLRKRTHFALVAALLAACTSVDNIETSDPAALPAFKTFQVQQIQFTFATDINSKQRERISKELRAAVVGALNARGYREAAPGDVLVTLGAMSRPTLSPEAESGRSQLHAVDTSVLDSNRSPSASSSATPPPPAVGREGDLILELLDPATQQSIWHASSTGTATTPSEALRKARATYAAMVARLPRAAQQ